MKNIKVNKIGKLLLDLLDIYIPAILFLTLFACFLLGIFFRYVLKQPQSWSFELSTICYLSVGVLSWGIAQREGENVVFDMLYNKLSSRTKCIMRIISNFLIAVTAAVLIGPSVGYIRDMAGLRAQTLPLPRGVIFIPFTVSFVLATVRSLYHLVQDVCAFRRTDYAQAYGKKEAVK